MKKILIYSYSKCSTCRKAIKWLDKQDLEHEVIDIVQTPPSKSIIKSILKTLSSDKKRIFNTRGKSFKDLNLKDFNHLTDEDLAELLIRDGKLIKRPCLIFDEKIFLLGFNEKEYESYLL